MAALRRLVVAVLVVMVCAVDMDESAESQLDELMLELVGEKAEMLDDALDIVEEGEELNEALEAGRRRRAEEARPQPAPPHGMGIGYAESLAA